MVRRPEEVLLRALLSEQAGSHTPGDVTYSITGGADEELFEINASTGQLTFINAPVYSEGQDNTYDVEVTATNKDDPATTDVQDINVEVATSTVLNQTSDAVDLVNFDADKDGTVEGDEGFQLASSLDAGSIEARDDL